MLASLAAAPLLVKPALAQEADAVDSAVDNLTQVIKVRTAASSAEQIQPHMHIQASAAGTLAWAKTAGGVLRP